MPPTGFWRDERHIFPVRVYYEDTDTAGVVYYANYLRLIERARMECLRLLAPEVLAQMDAAGLVLAVRRCVIDYLSPARLHDALHVVTCVQEVGGASFSLHQMVRREETDLADAKIRLVCMKLASGAPARLPNSLRQALQMRAEQL
ncbi:MAG: YbgC/FadM family acyl-CoA thioesterase [Alphaproteobacteria bacterium]|nr:MAG: YbgC/FadM family acyl-CoA thioesterase [Alphaproteobacteria bacterium]